MLARTLIAAAAAAALAVPVMAQQKQQQQQTQQRQTQQQDAATTRDRQQMSEQAQACLRDLEQIDRRLAEAGYGRAGPGGYGAYGAPYGRTAPPATASGRTGALEPLEASTPRADMYVLMRAGYLMAVQGHDEGCAAVVQAVNDIGDRYEEAIRTGRIDQDEMRRWRGEYLGSAVQVSELDRPLRTDEIIGTDVRNMRDEDLGDVEDVVLGADGQVKYVIVSTGGFLGMGEDLVPVRWSDLRLTAEPYRDTFVLDVSEETFEQAPRLENRESAARLGAEADNDVERFWQSADIDSGRQ